MQWQVWFWLKKSKFILPLKRESSQATAFTSMPLISKGLGCYERIFSYTYVHIKSTDPHHFLLVIKSSTLSCVYKKKKIQKSTFTFFQSIFLCEFQFHLSLISISLKQLQSNWSLHRLWGDVWYKEFRAGWKKLKERKRKNGQRGCTKDEEDMKLIKRQISNIDMQNMWNSMRQREKHRTKD